MAEFESNNGTNLSWFRGIYTSKETIIFSPTLFAEGNNFSPGFRAIFFPKMGLPHITWYKTCHDMSFLPQQCFPGNRKASVFFSLAYKKILWGKNMWISLPLVESRSDLPNLRSSKVDFKVDFLTKVERKSGTWLWSRLPKSTFNKALTSKTEAFR